MVKGRWTDRGRDGWMEKVTYRWKMLHIEVGAPPEKRLDVSIFLKRLIVSLPHRTSFPQISCAAKDMNSDKIII